VPLKYISNKLWGKNWIIWPELFHRNVLFSGLVMAQQELPCSHSNSDLAMLDKLLGPGIGTWSRTLELSLPLNDLPWYMCSWEPKRAVYHQDPFYIFFFFSLSQVSMVSCIQIFSLYFKHPKAEWCNELSTRTSTRINSWWIVCHLEPHLLLPPLD
jgi:hypothetical protein